MRAFFKRVVSRFLVPVTLWYLRKERKYSYQGIQLTVPSGVFHPGFFYSTKFVAGYLEGQALKDRTVLELGCGSGMLSILTARAGARVTASDLSVAAIRATGENVRRNGVSVRIIHSDLFDNLANDTFDWIVINPPYYAKDPVNETALAWNCGKNFEYFKKLFFQLGNHIHPSSSVIMVLTLGSELEKIVAIGRSAGFEFVLLKKNKVLFDRHDFLFRLTPAPGQHPV